MEKETLFIAFSTQKGGAGKTTLTVLVASYLHYVKGMNVAVVDCDYPQHSIAEMRKRDLKTVMEDEHYKLMAYRQLQRIRKKGRLFEFRPSPQSHQSRVNWICGGLLSRRQIGKLLPFFG